MHHIMPSARAKNLPQHWTTTTCLCLGPWCPQNGTQSGAPARQSFTLSLYQAVVELIYACPQHQRLYTQKGLQIQTHTNAHVVTYIYTNTGSHARAMPHPHHRPYMSPTHPVPHTHSHTESTHFPPTHTHSHTKSTHPPPTHAHLYAHRPAHHTNTIGLQWQSSLPLILGVLDT